MAVLIHIVINFGISTTFVRFYYYSSAYVHRIHFLRIQAHLFANTVTISYNSGTQCRIDFCKTCCTYRMHMLATCGHFLSHFFTGRIALSYIHSISISINHQHLHTFMTLGFNSISEYRLLGNLFRRLSFVVIFFTHDVRNRLAIFSSWESDIILDS